MATRTMSASVRKMKSDPDWWVQRDVTCPFDFKLRHIHNRIVELQRMMQNTSSLIRKRNIGRKLHSLHAQKDYWDAQKTAWTLALP